MSVYWCIELVLFINIESLCTEPRGKKSYYAPPPKEKEIIDTHRTWSLCKCIIWSAWTYLMWRYWNLLLKWLYIPMQTFGSLMDFSQSALCFDPSFHFVILQILISVCTQFHHLVFVHPLSRLPCLDLLFFYCPFCVYMTNPWLTLTHWSIPKYPNSSINSVLYRFLQFSLTLIPPKHFP
jgi:hypothetical protein